MYSDERNKTVIAVPIKPRCPWSFGNAHCSLIMIPRGEVLSGVGAAALQWTGENTFKDQDKWTGILSAYNAAAIDEENLLLRLGLVPLISQGKYLYGVSRWSLASKAHRFLWVQGGPWQGHDIARRPAIVAAHLGEDARGFWFDRSSLFAVYNKIHMNPLVSHGHEVRMHVRNLSAHPHSREVTLHITGETPERKEKNWAPFVHRGQALFSYALYPQHVVLACSLQNGQCMRKHTTPSEAVFRRRTIDEWDKNPGLLSTARLSAPPLLLPARASRRTMMLGVGHSSASSIYYHFLYEMQTKPPFAILRASRPFRFFSSACPSGTHPAVTAINFVTLEGERVMKEGKAGTMDASDLGTRLSCGPLKLQYVAGWYLTSSGTDVAITFGIGDTASMRVVMSVKQVLRVLEEEEDGSSTTGYVEDNGLPSCRAHDNHTIAPCDDRTCDHVSGTDARARGGRAVVAKCNLRWRALPSCNMYETDSPTRRRPRACTVIM